MSTLTALPAGPTASASAGAASASASAGAASASPGDVTPPEEEPGSPGVVRGSIVPAALAALAALGTLTLLAVVAGTAVLTFVGFFAG